MKKLLPVLLISVLLTLLTGCSKSTLQNTAIKYGVSQAVQYGVTQYPDAKPYLQAVAPVICAAGNGTNLSPDAVITALESSSAANAVKTTGGTVVANMVITIYSGVWQAYGAGTVETNVALKGALIAVCDGMTEGLSNRSRAMHRYLK